MPKSRKEVRKAPPPEDTQNLYARAYAARLAKQVEDELSHSRRPKPRKNPDGKA